MSIQSHYEQLKKTVVQRLKWAAGANPVLAQTLILFEETLAVDQALLEVCQLLEYHWILFCPLFLLLAIHLLFGIIFITTLM